ncbi:MAG: hypothetical protein IKX88_12275, partial [Thermoguttaceae bacterium]|nr:hypothetical protein [Thermoguttaceae bacterium]
MQPVMAAFVLALGAWTAQFNEDAQVLTLTNAESSVELSGELSFIVDDKAWRVCLPRDGVSSRLALVDPNNDAQGYITFSAQGDRLEALVYHRTRQFYNGTLTYKGDVSFREESFPCRTTPAVGERVLSLASGTADSSAFDS